MSKFLTDKVTSMIAEALRGRPSTAPPLLPLVRLRVDYTGFSTINTQRFGHGFVGKVANPHDIILWQKAAVRRARDAASAGAGAAGGVPHPDGADEQKIEDLIAAHLHQNLEILPETELTDALRDYVDKDVKSAINDTVGRALQETQAAAAKDGVGHGAPANADVDGDAAMIDAGGENSAAERPLKKPKKEEDELAAAIASAAQKRKASAAVAATLRRARETQPATETATGAAGAPSASIIAPFEDMAEDEPGPSTKSRGRAAVKAKPPRAPAAALDAAASKPRGRRTAGPTASALGMEPLGLTAATEAATPASRAGRTRTAAAAAKHKLSAYRGAVDDDRSGDEDVRERDLMEEDADPISDSEDDDLMEEEVVASVQPSARRRGAANRRAAPGNVLGSAAQTISLLDSDDEDEVGEGRGRGGRTQGTVVGPTPSAAAAGRSQLTLGRLGASQAGNRWGSLK